MTRAWRWFPWAVLAVVAVAVLAVGMQRSSHPTLDQQALHIAGLVRCPVCEGQSAAQSDAPASMQIRNQIRQELAAGQNQGQILSGLVSAYGPGILEKPEARGVGLVVWAVPVIVVVLAVVGLGVAFARWRPKGALTVTDADRALVERALGGPPGRGDEGDSGDG